MIASHLDGLWVAVRVHGRHEKKVAEQLSSNGYICFLPLQKKKKGVYNDSTATEPLFPGYLFCRYRAKSTFRIVQAPGVVNIVSFCNIPAIISEEEIDSIFKIVNSNLSPESWQFPQEGNMVRINSGPLVGVEGVLVSGTNPSKVVVNVVVLKRSIAVTIHNSDLIPI